MGAESIQKHVHIKKRSIGENMSLAISSDQPERAAQISGYAVREEGGQLETPQAPPHDGVRGAAAAVAEGWQPPVAVTCCCNCIQRERERLEPALVCVFVFCPNPIPQYGN